MPSSPVTISQFQVYLKDTSTDPALLTFYQSLLDATTNKIATYLDRDFTALAHTHDTFWGNNTNEHILHDAASSVLTWTYTDLDGHIQTGSNTDLILFEEGRLVRNKVTIFEENVEYTINYANTSTGWPQAVEQVIIEDAAILFNESNQGGGTLAELIASSREGQFTERVRYTDLTQAHEKILNMYKRFAV